MRRARFSVRLLAAGAAAALALAPTTPAFAWGATGHRIVGRVAIASLPAALPAFLRTPSVVDRVGELAREPDRSKGAGQPHDADADPGHFVNLDDAGHAGGPEGPTLDTLPPNRAAFGAAVRAAGGEAPVGWLPYAIMDGYQQLVRDFAYWRVESVLARRATSARERAWYASDLKLREALIVRDIGVWAHYVGDASQPMHVSIHYNGWGPGPNPHGYTQEKIHGPFEGAFVHDHVTEGEVRAAMTPPTDCGPELRACVAAYLKRTLATVEPVYALWGEGGFTTMGDRRGEASATERLAAAAAELGYLIARAYAESEGASIGYKPSYAVRAIEDGLVPPFGAIYGDD